MAADYPEEPVQAIVELLHGLGAILMSIDAHVERIIETLGGDENGEEDQS